jgi:hypothetical protein
MSRAPLLALVLALGVASVCAAGVSAPTNFFRIYVALKQKGKTEFASVYLHVRVTDGRLGLSRRGDRGDEEKPRAAPGRWYLLGTKIKSSVGGGYLAYDPSGKDPRVFLSPTAGEGTDWTIRGPGGVKFTNWLGAVQAASGKVKGWHLDCEEYERKGEGGKVTTAYRLVLRKAAPRTDVRVDRVYLYRSTAR